MLPLLLIILGITITLVAILPFRWIRFASIIAFCGTISVFCLVLFLGLVVNPYRPGNFFSVWSVPITTTYTVHFGFDMLSYYLILLTVFIFSCCFLMVNSANLNNQRGYILLLLVMEIMLFGVFLALDFLVFYLFFEISLIPMFLLIGRWGSKPRRSKAALYLFIYTFFGSLFMLFVIVFLYHWYGTLNYVNLLEKPLDESIQKIIWPAVFFAFAIKIPMFPFHIWLPEAHVEAPTGGSVILAAIFLKMGGYGMLRFLIPLFPDASVYYAPFASILALMGAVYSSFTALRQIDMKRVVAYSSIAHMNIGLLGLFTLELNGIMGFYYLMIGHGLISGALFFVVGVLYDRYHTRLFLYFSGLVIRMPLLGLFFFVFVLANIGFPGTWNFLGEVFVFFSIMGQSLLKILYLCITIFITALYVLYLYIRIMLGTLQYKLMLRFYYYDLTRREVYLFVCILYLITLGGLSPDLVLAAIEEDILWLLSFFRRD